MFTRPQFDAACRAFSSRYSQWTWTEHPRVGYGYLSRNAVHFRRDSPNTEHDVLSEDDLEAGDLATASTPRPVVAVKEYIVYSASYNVPAFYFTIHHANGAPLALSELIHTTLFKVELPPGADVTSFALTSPSAPFPLLSQGDHPTLGIPCWYFHPCETDKAVGEFMDEMEMVGWTDEQKGARWLELWLMIVGGVVDVSTI